MIYQTVTLDVSDLELIGVMVMSTETEQDKKFEAMQKSMDLMAEELSVLREKELIKKEKKLAFKGEDYVMTERHLFAKLPMLAVKHPYAHYALMFLIHKMSKTNAVFISQKGLAQLMGCSLSTSKRSIKFLTEHNYIKIGKVGVQNFYQLNANIVWRSSRAMKQKVESLKRRSSLLKTSKIQII